MASETTLVLSQLADLERFSCWLASRLVPGDVICLNGPMGAGKTTFTQFLGKAMGVREKVVSPTFTLMHEYGMGEALAARLLVHVDLYRLGPEGAEGLADEMFSVMEEEQAVLVVEWAEYGDFLQPMTTLTLQFDIQPDDSRVFTITAKRPALAEELRHYVHR
jgi:tRNA threonylcarbamoyladenosine biosynthesis protein TsaE